MDLVVVERGLRKTPWGPAMHVQIRRADWKRMGWLQVWRAFAERYPGCWALEVYPPEEHLVDEANAYHLFVLQEGEVPESLRIDSRSVAEATAVAKEARRR